MRKTLTLPAELGVLDTVHRELLDFLSGVGTEIVEEMFLVAEEILVNTISYGYSDNEPHRIELELSFEEGLFRMRFVDDGVAYDPFDADEPDLGAPMAERRIGGLGVHLVKSLTDSASYLREGDENILIVERKVS